MRFFLVTFAITFLIFEVQSSDKVGKVKDLGYLKFPNSRIAYINPSKGAIYEINQEGKYRGAMRYRSKLLAQGNFAKAPI